MAGFEGVAMIDGFIAHVLAQDTSISGETRHSHTNVVVDLEHLLLVAGKVTGKALEAAQHLIRMLWLRRGYSSECQDRYCLA